VVLGAGAAAEAEECGHRMLICSAGYSLVKDPTPVQTIPKAVTMEDVRKTAERTG
jgi:hypothetical protein